MVVSSQIGSWMLVIHLGSPFKNLDADIGPTHGLFLLELSTALELGSVFP